jgi:hypothetical protein
MFVLPDNSVTGSDFRSVAVKKAKGASGHLPHRQTEQTSYRTIYGERQEKISWEKSYCVLVIRFNL